VDVIFCGSIAPLGARVVLNENDLVLFEDYVCSTKGESRKVPSECVLLYFCERLPERRTLRLIYIIVFDARPNAELEDGATSFCWVHNALKSHPRPQEGREAAPKVIDVSLNY